MSRVSLGKIKKISRFGMLQNFIYDLYLGMANHGMSKVVTAFRGISCDRGVVTQQQT